MRLYRSRSVKGRKSFGGKTKRSKAPQQEGPAAAIISNYLQTMSTQIFLIAHTPLASALREGALHVFPDCAAHVLVLDVQPDAAPEATLAQAEKILESAAQESVLVLTDVFGATPCNVAQRLIAGRNARLLTGANLPMLLRSVCYRHEPLDALMQRALVGGTQGVMQVEPQPLPSSSNQHP